MRGFALTTFLASLILSEAAPAGKVKKNNLQPHASDGSAVKAMRHQAAYEDSKEQCSMGHKTGSVILDLHAHRHPKDFEAELLKHAAGNTIHHKFTTTKWGLAATLSDETITHFLDHKDIKHIKADCYFPSPDDDTPEFVQYKMPRGQNASHEIGKQQTNPANWGLDRIDDSSGLDASYHSGDYDGTGTIVYILDTGVQISHPDFDGRAEGGFTAGTNANWLTEGVITSATSTCNNHGTHCASTACGSTYGVAKKAKVITVQVLACCRRDRGWRGLSSEHDSECFASWSGIHAGIEWATNDAIARDMKDKAVISMSLGGGGGGNVFDGQITDVKNAGLVVVVAAGNGDAYGTPVDACGYDPAGAADAITVGASDSSDRMASFSNYGSCIDIIAPGVGIVAAVPYSGSTPASASLSGTSMACPHVAGAAAAILSMNPMSPDKLVEAIKCAEVKNKISRRTQNAATNNDFLQAGEDLLEKGCGSTPPMMVKGCAYSWGCDGLFTVIGAYGGYPLYQLTKGGYTWSLYRRTAGFWVIDFDSVDESWSGTVNYSPTTSIMAKETTFNTASMMVYDALPVKVTGSAYGYNGWSDGIYQPVSNYGGDTVYEKQCTGWCGHSSGSWHLYKRKTNQWVLDFDSAIDESWGGTVNYSPNTGKNDPMRTSWNNANMVVTVKELGATTKQMKADVVALQEQEHAQEAVKPLDKDHVDYAHTDGHPVPQPIHQPPNSGEPDDGDKNPPCDAEDTDCIHPMVAEEVPQPVRM